jgi:hypothetical protein
VRRPPVTNSAIAARIATTPTISRIRGHVVPYD